MTEARAKLKAAICKSHPPTARYLVETAAVCLDHGLQLAEPGFELRPVAWSLVTKTVTFKCPKVSNLLDKLHGTTGQKYFRLLGTTQSGLPELVAANLDKLVTSENSSSVSQLLQQVSSSIGQPSKSSSKVSSLAASLAATSLADTDCKMPMTADGASRKQITERPAALLPDASDGVRRLMPGVAWSESSSEDAAQAKPVTEADSCDTSSRSKQVIMHTAFVITSQQASQSRLDCDTPPWLNHHACISHGGQRDAAHVQSMHLFVSLCRCCVHRLIKHKHSNDCVADLLFRTMHNLASCYPEECQSSLYLSKVARLKQPICKPTL